MKKTSILHLVTSLGQGGAERQLATIVNHSVSTENYVLSFYDHIGGYKIERDRISVFKAQGYIGRLFELRTIIHKQKSDVIFAWGLIPYLYASVAVLGEKPKIINGSIRHGEYVKSRYSSFVKWLLNRAKNVVANSKAGLDAYDIKNGFVLYNGIDPKFDKSRWKNEPPKQLKTPVLISVAQMRPTKDYFTVLEALKKIKEEGFDFYYLVIGDGQLFDEVKRMVKNSGLVEHVKLLGKISDPEKYLAQADIFIHSSRSEGCANAILEAMYMGLPVIATNTGGTPEIVGSNALLFDHKGVHQLQNAIKILLQDDELRISMAEQSYRLASTRFSVKRMIENYENYINTIAK